MQTARRPTWIHSGREFQISIDEYLAICEERGIEPQLPFSGKLNLRLGPDLHARVAALAAQNGMSINSWIKETLEREAVHTGAELSSARFAARVQRD